LNDISQPLDKEDHIIERLLREGATAEQLEDSSYDMVEHALAEQRVPIRSIAMITHSIDSSQTRI